MTELRVELSKVLERFGLDQATAAGIAHRVNNVHVEALHNALSQHAPAGGITLVPLVATPKPLLMPIAKGRPDIAAHVVADEYVEVTISKVKESGNYFHLFGSCVYNGREYSFKDSENIEVLEARKLINYLIQEFKIVDLKGFADKKIWVRFVEKGLPVRKVGEFLTNEDYHELIPSDTLPAKTARQ